MITFTARIHKLGINPVIDPPERILIGLFEDAGRSTGPIPVRGKLNGAAFTQTLVKYAGAWRLYVNGSMLADSGLSVGDTAEVRIEFDPRSRDIPVPAPLAAAFKRDKNAKNAFDQLAPSRQKEILRYIGSLKTNGAIEKNVDWIIEQLRNASGGRRGR